MCVDRTHDAHLSNTNGWANNVQNLLPKANRWRRFDFLVAHQERVSHLVIFFPSVSAIVYVPFNFYFLLSLLINLRKSSVSVCSTNEWYLFRGSGTRVTPHILWMHTLPFSASFSGLVCTRRQPVLVAKKASHAGRVRLVLVEWSLGMCCWLHMPGIEHANPTIHTHQQSCVGCSVHWWTGEYGVLSSGVCLKSTRVVVYHRE